VEFPRQTAAELMRRPRIGVVLVFLAGLVAAIYLFVSVGFQPVIQSVARAGFSGLALLCVYALLVFVVLGFAWSSLLPPAHRRPFMDFYMGRLVRDSIAEISPFSPVGGMVAAARLMLLKGMKGAYAVASVAADATTEAMAQAAFLAFGLGLGLARFPELHRSGILTSTMGIMLLLAVPGIAGLIVLQRRGAGFAERLSARFMPRMTGGVRFHDAMHAMYDSKSRLTLSAVLHLLGWVGAGGGTFLSFWLVGGKISILNAIALEALLSTIRSLAAFVPAAIGVQEAGYVMLAPLFGLPAEMGLAVSLLKRAREIVLGVPALLYWQGVEGRAALAADREEASWRGAENESADPGRTTGEQS
jgi:putative membrane protein